MDLAEKVIKANERLENREGYDELGLKIFKDNPEYLAARALRLNYLRRLDGKPELLHTRSNRTELWLGHKRLSPTPDTIYKLTLYQKTLKPWLVISTWDKLLEFAPPLDESKLLIDAFTYWDIEKGELCHSDTALEAIE